MALKKKHFTCSVSLEIQLQLIKIEETWGRGGAGREEEFSEKSEKIENISVLSHQFRLGSTDNFHSDFSFATAEQEDDLFVGLCFFTQFFSVFCNNWHADRRSR